VVRYIHETIHTNFHGSTWRGFNLRALDKFIFFAKKTIFGTRLWSYVKTTIFHVELWKFIWTISIHIPVHRKKNYCSIIPRAWDIALQSSVRFFTGWNFYRFRANSFCAHSTTKLTCSSSCPGCRRCCPQHVSRHSAANATWKYPWNNQYRQRAFRAF